VTPSEDTLNSLKTSIDLLMILHLYLTSCKTAENIVVKNGLETVTQTAMDSFSKPIHR
jgi:hypothetical protein